MSWKILKSRSIIKNSFFEVKEDKCKKSDGVVVKRYFTVNRPDAVVIAAFTPKKEIILIHQYRHPVKSTDYELPAGYLEPRDKNIKKAAERELLEETGYKAFKIKKIGETYASAGLMNNKVHFFMAENAVKIQELKLDENEEIEVKITPWKKALKLLKQQKIKDIGSVTGILLAEKFKK